MPKYKLPPGVSSVTTHGKQFDVDEFGQIELGGEDSDVVANLVNLAGAVPVRDDHPPIPPPVRPPAVLTHVMNGAKVTIDIEALLSAAFANVAEKPAVVANLDKPGTRDGEFVLSLLDTGLYRWDGTTKTWARHYLGRGTLPPAGNIAAQLAASGAMTTVLLEGKPLILTDAERAALPPLGVIDPAAPDAAMLVTGVAEDAAPPASDTPPPEAPALDAPVQLDPKKRGKLRPPSAPPATPAA